MNWFDVDKAGLAKLIEQRGRGFAILELLQNSWDQNVTEVRVTIEPFPGSPYARITVTDDDPAGFANLSHAFTLFAESTKKSDPSKRGRFNLGEKLVLACCTQATITSTTGTVLFTDQGREVHPRRRRPEGSEFMGIMRMTRAEMDESLRLLRTTLPPVPTWVNGTLLPTRKSLASWTQTLQTEIADAEGFLRRAQRITKVEAFDVLEGEVGTLYELGIPVVETGDRWHVSVGQKVPVTLDRTNVPPHYLRDVRVGLLNAMVHGLETKDDATAPWVRDAASHPAVAGEAIRQVMDLRFGEKRVAYDPSDPEANKLATAGGYTVVTGGSLSAAEWENARKANAVPPAGQVTPSPKPFSPDGTPLKTVERADWRASWLAFEQFATRVADAAVGGPVTLVIADDPGWGHRAACGPARTLYWNVATEGADFFDYGPYERTLALLIHELAHVAVSDHLSRAFYDELCRIGAVTVRLAVEHPEFFTVKPR